MSAHYDVVVIGAGPGDPGLMTVRGLQCLQSADVVLYDHLVPARMLRSARPDAEKIDVGTAAPQPLEQEAICYLLAEKARLIADDGAGATLTFEAMAHGDARRFAFDRQRELTAATGDTSGRHEQAPG